MRTRRQPAEWGQVGAVEFRILGPLTIETPDGPADLRGPKRRGLCALLLLHAGGALPLDRIVDALWDDGASGAAGTVQTYVSQLRRLLATAHGEVTITTVPGGYRLDVARERIDACRFEDLARAGLAEPDASHARDTLHDALACWHGPALSEFRGAPWADAAAEALELRRLQVLEGRIDADLALGQAADVVAELDMLVRDHPLHERFWAQRMTALYRCGRQGEALRAYGELRALLADELGIEPSTELRELELRILDHDPTLLAPHATAEAPAPSAPVPVASLPTGTVTFVLTDIVGSTELWDRHPDAMASALERHEALIAAAVHACGGTVLKQRGEGDSTMSVFSRAADGLAAAIALRDALVGESWPDDLRIEARVAVHTGEIESRDGDYFGPAVNRAARLRAIASGGEILCSRATADLVADRLPPGVTLAELGAVRLRGLRRNEVVYRVARASEMTEARERSASAEPGTLAPEPPARVDLRDETVLIAREAELQRLVETFETADTGRAQVVFVRGDAGVGKTRLVHELVEQVGTEVDVHVVACSPHSAAPLVALADLVETGAPAALPRREDVVALLRSGSDDDDADVARLRSLTALRDAIRSLATERAAIVVLEDVHWAGAGLLDAIEFLVHDLVTARRDCRLTLLVTRRTFAVSPEVEATLARLERLPGIRTMSLHPMREVDVDELLRGYGVDPPGRQLVHLMYERSRGNPLYVREALRRIADLDGFVHRAGRIETVVPATELGAPADLGELVERRLATLPDDVLDLLALAAVAGETFDPVVLEGVGGDRIEELLVVAAQAGIVAETAAGYRFTHAVQRAALYDGLPRARRRMHHRTLATALDRLPEEQRSAHLLELAHHLLEAGLDEVAPHTAVDLWEAGRRAAAFTDWGTSARCYEGAITIAARAGADPSTLAWMKYWTGRSHERHYDSARALHRYDEALREGRSSGDVQLWARAALAVATRTSIAQRGAVTGNFDPSVLTEALDAVEASDARLRARLQRKYAEMQYQAGDLAGGLECALEATELAESAGDEDLLAHCQSTLAYGHLFAGRATEARALLEPLCARTHTGASAEIAGFALIRLALAELCLGQLRAAQRTAREALTVFETAQQHTGTALSHTVAADVAIRAGDLAAAEIHGREAERRYAISEYSFVPAMLYSGLAEARSEAGDHDGAQRAVDAWRATGERGSLLTSLLVTARRGELDAARAGLERRLTALDRVLVPDALLPGRLGVLAELAHRLGLPDLAHRVLEALDHLADPRAVFGPGLPFHVAWTRATALAATHDPGAAAAYDLAIEASETIGADGEARRARRWRDRVSASS